VNSGEMGFSFLDSYAKSAYGNPFAVLTNDQRTSVLTDLWNNKPTNFTGPNPKEFFSEMHNLVMEGFFSDPIYGGTSAWYHGNLTDLTALTAEHLKDILRCRRWFWIIQ